MTAHDHDPRDLSQDPTRAPEYEPTEPDPAPWLHAVDFPETDEDPLEASGDGIPAYDAEHETSVDPSLLRPPHPAKPQRKRPLRPRRSAWRGETPTDPMPMLDILRRSPYRDPRVTRAAAEEREARAAMDLALRVAEVMLRCGAGAPRVEASVVAVGMAGGLDNLDVDITLQSLLMQSTTASGQRITILRVVRSPRKDFARLTAVHSLVDDLVSGEVEIEEAAERLRTITRTRRMWSSWVVTLASGILAGAVAMSLGALWAATVTAILSTVVVDRLVVALGKRGIPDFYQSAVGGFAATSIAWVAYTLGVLDWIPVRPEDFAYIVAGGIVVLLPSLTIASAMEDVITGYSVTGTSRIFSVLFHTLGLILGVGAGLGITSRVGTALGLVRSQPPIDSMAWASAPVPIVIVASMLIGASGAVTLQCRRRQLIPAALLCVVAVVTALTLTDTLGLGRVTSVGFAALLIGFLGRLIAVRLDTPGMVFIVPATLGLLPGLTIFVGMYQLAVGTSDTASNVTMQFGATAMFTALGILMAIATGATLGEILAAPFDSSVVERRRLRRGSHRRRHRPESAG